MCLRDELAFVDERKEGRSDYVTDLEFEMDAKGSRLSTQPRPRELGSCHRSGLASGAASKARQN